MCSWEGGFLVVQDQPQGWILEAAQFHGPNVVSCEVITNGKRTQIISAYILPSTLEHLPDLKEALTCFQDQDPIFIGEISNDIGKSQNPFSQQVADLLVGFSLMDLLLHFQKRWQYQHMTMWPQLIQGRLMWEIIH